MHGWCNKWLRTSVSKNAKKWFSSHQLPIVLGGSDFFLTDHHHHALAIQLTGDHTIWELDIQLYVQCDLQSAGTNFWNEMQTRNYNLLINRPDDSSFALPSPVSPSTLPTGWALDSFTDNMWHSLVGFASHVDDLQSRCYIKKCIEFVDYEWSYMINFATENDKSLWPAGSDPAGFKSMFQGLAYKPDPQHVNVQEWEAAAADALPLCHSESVKACQLPSFFPTSELLGWSATPVPPDPECRYTQCSSRGCESQRTSNGNGIVV